MNAIRTVTIAASLAAFLALPGLAHADTTL